MEAFLLSRRVANCSRHTIGVYARNLGRFAQTAGTELAACTLLDMQRYLSGLSQRLKPVSTHQHFRSIDAGSSSSLASVPQAGANAAASSRLGSL